MHTFYLRIFSQVMMNWEICAAKFTQNATRSMRKDMTWKPRSPNSIPKLKISKSKSWISAEVSTGSLVKNRIVWDIGWLHFTTYGYELYIECRGCLGTATLDIRIAHKKCATLNRAQIKEWRSIALQCAGGQNQMIQPYVCSLLVKCCSLICAQHQKLLLHSYIKSLTF